MSSYCDYVDGNCKYCEEGQCDFPIQGSGYPYEAPCFGYEKEDDEGEWLPVMTNKRMLKCSNCLFWVSKELIYDYTDPNPLVFKYCPNCGKKMKERRKGRFDWQARAQEFANELNKEEK